MVKIPKTMSTQHPDNANIPFFARSPVLEGDDEIQEVFYAFTHLGCDEQMWDYEGKEVDNFVVKKLLTKYASLLEEKRLGRDIFLTLRVPNPEIEVTEAKILLETLESIPRSYDAAHVIYNDDIAPIFEVIQPQTLSADSLNRIYQYYKNFVVGKQHTKFTNENLTLAEWIGKFKPDEINVIPLLEEKEHMLNIHNVLKHYLKDKETFYQRVFLARSDPALNYGIISAVLINKIALQRLYVLGEEINVKMYPIIGVGSAPFRGNLNPMTCDRVVHEYPSVHTFTIQSSFKYDYPVYDVRHGVKKLREKSKTTPREIDEDRCIQIIEKYSTEYNKQILELIPEINKMARFIPARRARKLHIGLFGYSRKIGDKQLPRAITFTAALYSMGLPPELLGIDILDSRDLSTIRENYMNFDQDLADAMKYFNPDSPIIPESLKNQLKKMPFDYEMDERHKRISTEIVNNIRKNTYADLSQLVLECANIRKFLG